MAVEEELPWTTTRCNRLLRPLSSKLAKLRTQCERPRSEDTETRRISTAFATKTSPHKTTNFTRLAYKPRGFEKAKDPDWRPGTKPAAGKKTYGGRGARGLTNIRQNNANASHVSRPGEIAFTPLVTRVGNQLHSSPLVQHSPLKKYAKNRGPLQVNVDWTQMPGESRKLVQGVLEAYANILQATADGDEKSWRGTRSLMNACLRKLPAYIELEEYFAKLDREAEMDDEERNVADEIYEHLETQFEQRPGLGWRPFKQVVRAHATSLLCDAVMDQVIGLDSLSTLVTHCVRVAAWEEAERLLIAYIPLLEPLSIPINVKADFFDAQRSPYLNAVKSFVDHTGRHRLLYDLLEHMIAYELLPLEWLATERMKPMWDRLVRSISGNQQQTVAQALRFFETVMVAGIGLPDERLLADEATGARRFKPSSREEFRVALNTTYSSFLRIVCGLPIVYKNQENESGRAIAQRITWMLDTVVIATLTRGDIQAELQLLEADAEDGQAFLQRAMWITFASILVRLENCPRDMSTVSLDISELISTLNWVATQYSSHGVNTAACFGSLPTFISMIARNVGGMSKDGGFDLLQRLTQTLMSLSGYRMSHKLWTLKRLALECAIEFAQDTGKSEHLTFARELEKKMSTQGRLVIIPSPQKNDSPTTSRGFRWEEGIGEWVTCTPAMKQGMKQLVRKPVPLELPLTPAQSEDDDGLPASESCDGSIEETTAFSQDDDDEVPHSSPIKKAPRLSTSSLGKRSRASSPMVMVPKRARITPPNSPVQFYAELPGEETSAAEEPRRSRRSKTEIKALASRLKTQRSRTSLDSGLRNQQRKTYIDPTVSDDNTTSDTTSPTPSSESDTQSLSRKTTRHSRRKQPNLPQHNEPPPDTDERDDLGITPARPRRKRQTSIHKIPPGRRSWWKFNNRVLADSEDDVSEDELSFH